ncbi:MAG: DUF3426 domain-containing protein [Geminicoccaceae bacterium]|nr:DUF3426 domain-containing protein [Geminicoccaceae bacterium]
MIVTCPSCGASFRLDPARLGPSGKRVRCSACGHRWLVAAPTAEPATTAEPAQAPPARPSAAEPALVPPSAAEPPPPSAPSEPDLAELTSRIRQIVLAREDQPAGEAGAEPPPLAAAPSLGTPPSGRGVAIAGWLVLVLLLLTLAGLVVGRNEIASAFPATVGMYERLGLPVTVRLGLEIKNLASRRVRDQGLEIFVVEGEIHNLSGTERAVPPVRVALVDAERNELDWALFKADQASLPAGGITRFEARIVDPPTAAKTFRVSLEPGR